MAEEANVAAGGPTMMDRVNEEFERIALADKIQSAGFDPDCVVRFDCPSFDDAAVGMTSDGRLVYDYGLMIKSMARKDGISEEDAMEFIDYNTIRSIPYAGENAPVVMFRFDRP